MRLSLLVTGVTYRHPGLLAKTVATLDVLSGGRAMLGIGAAWYEREHAGLGVPFPPLKERFDRLEETLQICRSEQRGRGPGPVLRHALPARRDRAPAPLQSRPPILIGGSGERKTLRLVAMYADACNLFGESPEVVAHKLDVLRRHCDDVGRDYDSIRKTMIAMGDRSATGPLPVGDGAVRRRGDQPGDAGAAGRRPVAWTSRLCEDVLPRLKVV